MFDAAQKTILQQLKMFFLVQFKSTDLRKYGEFEARILIIWFFGVCYDIIGGKGWFYLIFAQGWILYTFVYIPMRVHQRENNLDTQKRIWRRNFFSVHISAYRPNWENPNPYLESARDSASNELPNTPIVQSRLSVGFGPLRP